MTENMIPDDAPLSVSGEWSNPADVAVELAPDPCGDKLIGDSFVAPVDNPLQRAVLCCATNGHGQRCGRREHPVAWQHFEVVDNRITAAWRTGEGRHHQGVPIADLLAAAERRVIEHAGVPLAPELVDPLAHVGVGDPDPEPHVTDVRVMCGARGYIGTQVGDRMLYAECSRPRHPEHWAHIAVDGDEVVEVWHTQHTPADAEVADAIEELLDEHADDVAEEPFDDERQAHVERAFVAAVRVEDGLLDSHRREVTARVFTAYGELSADQLSALPGGLLKALERAAVVLGEPLDPSSVALVESVRAGAGR